MDSRANLLLGPTLLLSLCWVICVQVRAQYPVCPSTALTEQIRKTISAKSKEFFRVLEKFQNRPAEIVFVLDSSGSVRHYEFACEIQFVRHFSKLFSMSPENSRVAVVTYSSCDKIYTDLDYINSPVGKNKCTLLGSDLRRTTYRAGGTCTVGGLRTAQNILAGSRQSTPKVVFLLTDGHSNDGGTPLKVAASLRNIATVFAVGLGTGINVAELNGIASSPSSEHVFLLSHLTDVEKLAQEVVGDQGDMASWDRNVPGDLCNSVCTSGQDCCDASATCSCATQTGSYGCACHPGNTGGGKKGECSVCPRGTYKPEYGNQACTQCPLLSTTAGLRSTSLSDCQCLPGHEGSPRNNVKCTPIMCDRLSFSPSSGILLIPPNCDNLYGTVCRMQCLKNYRAQPGTADSTECLASGQWSAEPLQCTQITCNVLPEPIHGQQSCSTEDWTIGTVCNLTCHEGYERNGALQRRCELNEVQQVGQWSDEAGTCKAQECPQLTINDKHMKIRPTACVNAPQRFTSECTYGCDEGFRLQGVSQNRCQANNTWSINATVENVCIDVEPPEFLSCSTEDVSLVTNRYQNFATTVLDQPVATDNSGEPVVEASQPIANDTRFYLGQPTVITYTARDQAGLNTTCTFSIVVKDEEKPRLTRCPNNIEAESASKSAEVTWEDPIFIDNSAQPLRMESNRLSRSEFYWGLPEKVWFRATDQSGNVEFCNFTVAVRQYRCPYYPPPRNGALACDKWLGGQFCRVSCNEKFDFNRDPGGLYLCKTVEGTNMAEWGPAPPTKPQSFRMPWPECTEIREPNLKVGLELEYFTGSCPDDDAAKAEIAADFVEFFRNLDKIAKGICEAGCSVENVEVLCESDVVQRRRRAVETQNVLQIQFTVVIDAPRTQARATNGSTSVAERTNSIQRIDNFMSKMDEVISKGQLNISGHGGSTLSPVGPVSVFQPITLFCRDGEVLRNQSCVSCPSGTYHDIEGGICQDCGVGFYQDIEGQLACLQCPQGTTTRATNSRYMEDCKAPCIKGTYSASGLKTCMACPRGSYQPATGASSCLQCPYGLTTWTEGAFSVDECSGECQRGSYSDTGYAPCTPCPIGTYQPNDVQTACITCPEGLFTHYEGAHALGYCQVINECESAPCGNGAICIDLPRSYRCQCPTGYTGQDCNVNINDCDHDLCLNNALCVDMVAGYHCNCTSGFEGDHCQIDIDECQSNPCHNRAVCTDGPNSYTCQCAPGFAGEFCKINYYDCASHPCQNEGTCVDLPMNFTCCCRPGYRGRYCEILVDHCQSAPCLNNGTCIAGFNSVTCLCSLGFKGDRCEIDVDECAVEQVVCYNGGTCRDNINGFECVCTPGYSGPNCETVLSGDFDLHFPTAQSSDFVLLRGVPLKPLHALTVAFWMRTTDVDGAGTPLSYATRGPDGLVQDNALTITNYGGLAIVINGQFMYTDQRLNSDSNWHHVVITWASLDGSWAIYVDNSVRRSGLDFMTGSVIQGSGALVIGQEQDSFAGTFAQTQSFVGDLSQLNVWDYAMTAREATATYASCAVMGNALAWSQVTSGIQGNINLIQSSQLCPAITNCQPSTCYNGATCTDLVGSFKCTCALGFHGTLCDQVTLGCAVDTCLNGGICRSNGTALFCSCTEGYTGDRCELQSDSCQSVTCLNGGRCTTINSLPQCNCASGFTGRVCEYDTNECAFQNGGCAHTCGNTPGSFVCSCLEGFALQSDGRSCNDASYCIHEGRFHLASDIWDFKCSVCHCEAGMAVCETKTCPETNCKEDEYEYQAPGACCLQCLPESRTCTVARDGSHVTYDLNRYDHTGNCRYVLSQDCVGSQFTVEVQYEATKRKIRRWALWVRIDCVEVEIDYLGSVKVTGIPVKLPYLHDEPKNVWVTTTNSSLADDGITIETNRGVVVRWSRTGSIEVSAPGNFRDQLCGLCGNMNGNRKDDRTTRQYLLARTAREFTHSWKVDGYRYCAKSSVRSSIRLEFGGISADKIAACNGLSFSFLKDVRKKCVILRRRSFQMCHSVVNPMRYFELCMQDACSCSSNEPCHCEAIADYLYECQRNDVAITWPADDPCNIQCPEGLIYDQCGPACIPSCQDPFPNGPSCRTKTCVPRCQCPAGTVFHKNACILPRYCPSRKD